MSDTKLWAEARERGAVPRWAKLSRQEAEEVRRKWTERRAYQDWQKSHKPELLINKWVLRRPAVIAKLKSEVMDTIPDIAYSMGGIRSIDVGARIGGVTQWRTISSIDTRQDYAKSCKYRAQHGLHSLRLTPTEARQAKVIGGVLTVAKRYPRSHKTTLRCKWIEWSREGRTKNYTPRWTHGFLCGDCHATTKKEAKGLMAEKRHQKAKRLWEQRRAARMSELIEAENRCKLEIYRFVPVTIEDSRAVGNCYPGTMAWARAKGITGDTVALGDLHRLAQGDTRALNVVEHVLSRLALLPARMI